MRTDFDGELSPQIEEGITKVSWIYKDQISEKLKRQQKRLEFENKNLALKGAKGSFVVFREEGLEDVFVADDL